MVGTSAISPGRTVAVVADDDAAVREMLHQALARWGYHPVAASDGAQAVEAIGAHRHDLTLVLFDVQMPEHSGIEVARAARMLGIQAPVVLMTGLDPNAVAASLDGLRVEAVLAKPLSLRALAATIQQFAPSPPVAAGGGAKDIASQ